MVCTSHRFSIGRTAYKMIREVLKLQAPYPKAFLFDIAQDVENYPLFLPNCIAARVLNKDNTCWRVENVYRWGPISRRFITYANVSPTDSIHITTDTRDKITLEVLWAFTEIMPEKTEVTFETGFASSIPMLEKIVQGLLREQAKQTEHAFLKRAELLMANHRA